MAFEIIYSIRMKQNIRRILCDFSHWSPNKWTTQGNIILKIKLNVNTVYSRREIKERENCTHSVDGQSIWQLWNYNFRTQHTLCSGWHFWERKKKVVKTLHKYKHIHKLFVRTAEVAVHKFSNCIATQSISTVRQKPQHEFRLITAHVHINLYMYLYTFWDSCGRYENRRHI